MENIVIKWAVFLTAFLISLKVNAQNVKVSGVMTGALGPIPEVNIMEEGTINDTVTDVNGKYSINVSAKSTLIFSCIGYKEQKIRVGTKTVLNVDMVEKSKTLDELVVVGYGVQRGGDVTTSVVSVKVGEMKTSPADNVANMLRGRATDANVTSGSGCLGSTPSITIHDSRSISVDNAPLYIMNGPPSSATEFNTSSADDIESVEVLKDAVSQAVYGAHASNGVVLMATKRGRTGEVEVGYNGCLGIRSLWRNFDFYSPEEYTQLRREAKAHDRGIVDAHEVSVIEVLEDEVMWRVWASGEFIDWERKMFRSAIYHNHDVSVRGETEEIRISAGANYFDQQGMVVTESGYQKFSLKLNLDFEISEWISSGINSSYVVTKQDREDSNFSDFITSSPLAEMYDVDGKYTKHINSEGNYNPLYRAQHYGREVSRDNYRLNFFMDVKPFKGFSYRLNAPIYNRTPEDGSYKDSQYPEDGGAAVLNESRMQSWLVENIVTYKVPAHNRKHRLTLTGVQSVDHSGSKSINYSVGNLPVDKDRNFVSRDEFTDRPRHQFNENSLVSFMAHAQYSLLDRYLLNVAVRRDGPNRSGKEDKWGTSPPAAFAWHVNQEDFLKDVSWIDSLRLRVSYGIVDNQNGIGNYTTLGLTDNKGYEFEDTFQMRYLPGKELSSPNLKWEQSATANLDVDFSFFNGHLNGTVEYYNTYTKDLLVERSSNASFGCTTMLDNLGKAESSGVDLPLNDDVIHMKEFTWSLRTNFSIYKSEIVRINDTPGENGRPASQTAQGWIIGEPINVYYDYLIDGIFRYDGFDTTRDGTSNLVYTLKSTYNSSNNGVTDSPIDYGGAIEPGMVKIRDSNGGGKITTDDRVPVQRDPKFTVSLSSTWNWKGLDLFMDWYGVSGRKIKNSYLCGYNSGGSLRGKLNGVKVDYWTPFNPSNEFPRPSYSTDPAYLSAIAIQNASYVRLRTSQLGYTFPAGLLGNTPIHKLRLYATATNLLTLTEFKSYNPELTPGSYPGSRRCVFGVDVSF